ncbi:MAG: hypothetical protein KFB96_18165 [Thiocapsa sp.]|uniref:hypothetical protein n=1 Tax=Thiocapsa sp. TaxID=2024551 RepID=UPI001BCA73A4|nr:hypothetical protein [Thiocapsa sp.]QVL47606.1 MAG: hypothetical protein KFB96_18165 [Thiocapsa sp.]
MLADHSNERLTQELAVQGGLMLVDLFAEEPGSRKHEVLRGALGIGAKCGLLLPYSRTHEREAARIGRDLMAQAGFDPVPALRSGGTWPPPAGSAVGLPLPLPRHAHGGAGHGHGAGRRDLSAGPCRGA